MVKYKVICPKSDYCEAYLCTHRIPHETQYIIADSGSKLSVCVGAFHRCPPCQKIKKKAKIPNLGALLW